MFKQRLLTTLILVPLVLCIIYYGSLGIFTAIISLLLIGAAFEGASLVPIHNFFIKAIFVVAIPALAYLYYLYFDSILLLSLVTLFLLIVAITSFPASQRVWGYRPIVALALLIVLPIFAAGLVYVYQLENGNNLIVYLLVIVWAVDIGAYLIGKQFGSHKLIPKVSPGKTIEGAIGGLILAFIVASIACYLFKINDIKNWFLLAFVLTIISMFGDLFISMLKRRVKLKDTGNLFPGHGGVLDRLDSLIAATPFFFKGLILLAGQ